MFHEVLALDVFDQRKDEAASSVGYDDVEMLNAVQIHQLLDHVKSSMLYDSIVLGRGDNEAGTLTLGQVGERLCSLVLRVANWGDDDLSEESASSSCSKEIRTSLYVVCTSQVALS